MAAIPIGTAPHYSQMHSQGFISQAAFPTCEQHYELSVNLCYSKPQLSPVRDVTLCSVRAGRWNRPNAIISFLTIQVLSLVSQNRILWPSSCCYPLMISPDVSSPPWQDVEKHTVTSHFDEMCSWDHKDLGVRKLVGVFSWPGGQEFSPEGLNLTLLQFSLQGPPSRMQ